MNFIHELGTLLQIRATRQALTLSGAQLAVVLLETGISIINARSLSPADFGVLSLYLTLMLFFIFFFDFGFFAAGARLLALSEEEDEERKLVGGLIIIAFLMGLCFSVTVFASSFLVDRLFKTGIKRILQRVAVITAVFPMQALLQQVCQGTNKISSLSAYNVSSKVLYLLGGIAIVSVSKLTLFRAIVLNLIVTIIATVSLILTLKPKFTGLRGSITKILGETRTYGVNMYVGNFLGMAAYNLDKPMISYFINPISVGFYLLAFNMAAIAVVLPRSLAVSMFKEFSRMKEIPPRLIRTNLIVSGIICLILALVGGKLLILLFSGKYAESSTIVLPLVLSAFFQSAYQPYNMFLSAKGKGVWLRNMAFEFAMLSVVLNVFLIPRWGIMGAAISNLVVCMIWYLRCRECYARLLGGDSTDL